MEREEERQSKADTHREKDAGMIKMVLVLVVLGLVMVVVVVLL